MKTSLVKSLNISKDDGKVTVIIYRCLLFVQTCILKKEEEEEESAST